ncbi:MAG TPA: hypothetical protein ENH94_10825 [Phycisphaerales bacterium]|nr:hypothetical protein [Phycisphaerales bacterium]
MTKAGTMREIDFIPLWYKAGRKRRVSYHRQYAVMGSVFALMLIWSFISGLSISNAKADIRSIEDKINTQIATFDEFNRLENTINGISNKAEILTKLDTGVDISAVIAEVSFILSERIVLSGFELSNELFTDKSGKSSSRVSIGSRMAREKSSLPENNTRFLVTIAGVAADASDVAGLIAKLEDSAYFCRIIPGFSRNREISGHLATEFEIKCYIANYIERKQTGS